MVRTDTIAAIATAPGRSGVGVIRLSGPKSSQILLALTGKAQTPEPRAAALLPFLDSHGQLLDRGLALYFPNPHSFTGEEVVELHAHGGDLLLHLLLERCVSLGARLAEPGEFTQRAFFNQKIDLVEAEAIADLIEAESAAAVRGAMRSLSGAFSRQVNELVAQLVELRMQIEGSIDFPEEGEEWLAQAGVFPQLQALQKTLISLNQRAAQGSLLRSGRQVVLVGAPNVGKSSLLNGLSEEEMALVTDVAGTTRDAIRNRILIRGLPLHVVDTAGIRETQDPLEQAGIRRTWEAIRAADFCMVVCDARVGMTPDDQKLIGQLPEGLPRMIVLNKCDLVEEGVMSKFPADWVRVSALTGEGMESLKDALAQWAGWAGEGENSFMARERHLAALARALGWLARALEPNQGVELVAENLRLTQLSLSEITGEFSSDDLLGEIFSRFCIGK